MIIDIAIIAIPAIKIWESKSANKKLFKKNWERENKEEEELKAFLITSKKEM